MWPRWNCLLVDRAEFLGQESSFLVCCCVFSCSTSGFKLCLKLQQTSAFSLGFFSPRDAVLAQVDLLFSKSGRSATRPSSSGRRGESSTHEETVAPGVVFVTCNTPSHTEWQVLACANATRIDRVSKSLNSCTRRLEKLESQYFLSQHGPCGSIREPPYVNNVCHGSSPGKTAGREASLGDSDRGEPRARMLTERVLSCHLAVPGSLLIRPATCVPSYRPCLGPSSCLAYTALTSYLFSVFPRLPTCIQLSTYCPTEHFQM